VTAQFLTLASAFVSALSFFTVASLCPLVWALVRVDLYRVKLAV
jgi:hypothetical protein